MATKKITHRHYYRHGPDTVDIHLDVVDILRGVAPASASHVEVAGEPRVVVEFPLGTSSHARQEARRILEAKGLVFALEE